MNSLTLITMAIGSGSVSRYSLVSSSPASRMISWGTYTWCKIINCSCLQCYYLLLSIVQNGGGGGGLLDLFPPSITTFCGYCLSDAY